MSNTFFEQQVRAHKAEQVHIGPHRQGTKHLPKPTDLPNTPIWFETSNFGWILSAKKADGTRSVLLKY